MMQEGKENSAEPIDEKRPVSILQRLRAFGPMPTKEMEQQRGPLGDVTNQSPVASPRAPAAATEHKGESDISISHPHVDSLNGEMALSQHKCIDGFLALLIHCPRLSAPDESTHTIYIIVCCTIFIELAS